MRIGLYLGLLAGCDPLASSEYVGEPLFVLEGTLVAPAPAETPDEAPGGVALLWQDSARAGGPGIAVTAVPVELEFPSTFRVPVPLPPPAEARFSFEDSDVQLAEAYVFVVADPGSPRPRPRGADRSHVLVYATADVEAGTLAADYLGGPLRAGYHLRRHARVAEPAGAQRLLVERCVANGALRAACETRRRYRLEAIDDDARLRIVVTP